MKMNQMKMNQIASKFEIAYIYNFWSIGYYSTKFKVTSKAKTDYKRAKFDQIWLSSSKVLEF